MTSLSMRESLPFDEESTPPPIPTGDLPEVQRVREVVTEAYERYRTDGDGTVADYTPVLDAAGNSVRGQLVTTFLAERLGLDLFASRASSSADGPGSGLSGRGRGRLWR